MKKQLLVGAFMLASFLTAQAQEYNYNSNDLTVGNIGTAIDGETEGQDGWLTLGDNGDPATSDITNANFQVIDHVTQGKLIQLTGPDGASGAAVLSHDKQGDFDNWNARTEGNNIYQIEYLYYSGTALADSKNGVGVAVQANDAAYKISCGLIVNTSNLEVYGRAYLPAAGGDAAGNYIIGLSETAGETFILPENTWVRMGASFNMATGEAIFRIKNLAGEVLVDGAITTGLAAVAPVGPDFLSLNMAAGNTASAVSLIDNVKISFSATDTLLAGGAGTEENLISSLSVFPNPANDVVNIANAENILINGVTVTDLNGRTVKTAKFDGVANAQVNVSDLASGVYMMTVSSDKGSMTKKIVKN